MWWKRREIYSSNEVLNFRLDANGGPASGMWPAHLVFGKYQRSYDDFREVEALSRSISTGFLYDVAMHINTVVYGRFREIDNFLFRWLSGPKLVQESERDVAVELLKQWKSFNQINSFYKLHLRYVKNVV